MTSTGTLYHICGSRDPDYTLIGYILKKNTHLNFIICGIMSAVCLGGAALSQSLSGSYLAANQANFNNDYTAASEYYSRAIEQDSQNHTLLQTALFSLIAKGDLNEAISLAKKIDALGIQSQLVALTLLTDHLKHENYTDAAALLDEHDQQFNPLLANLMRGWVYLGAGKMAAATEQFDMQGKPAALRILGQTHKAFALAMVGDFPSARAVFDEDDKGSLRWMRGSLIAQAQILSQLDQPAEALTILNEALVNSSDPEVSMMRDEIEAGKTLDFYFITNATEGAAEVFSTVASLVKRGETERFSLAYNRLAQYLNPTNVDVLLNIATGLQNQGQFDLANQAYTNVPAEHVMFLNAELGRASTLQASNKPEAAIEVLRGLVRSNKDAAIVHISLGDALSGNENFEQAAKSYSRAAEIIKTPSSQYWTLFYARGICYERLDRWEEAEVDFRRALTLAPNQPAVSNYLGYSLVEKNLKLDEAQELIENAVNARPENGFIADSLGWVLYRLGKFEPAVNQMERAIELEPTDPIINDHLGDVLWMVGRRIEADFQWRRAISFEPDEINLPRIRRKLEFGLDALLAEELAEEKSQTVTENEN